MRVRILICARLVACLFIAVGLLWPTPNALARPPSPEEVRTLVEDYAPVLYFHSEEIFRPQSVDVLLRTARLRQTRGTLPDANILSKVSLNALPSYHDLSYYLDVWLGDNGSSDARNYSALRDYYLRALSPSIGGPPVVTYAHMTSDEDSGQVTIQYWFFYFYNDWFNKHEGDWEMIQVMLDRAGETPVLFVEGASPRWPDTFDTSDALWDAPDLAWMAQSMPTWDLLKGLALSFLLAVVPAYIYLAVLYYADRYEKEPLRLVLTAFFWGAWPALRHRRQRAARPADAQHDRR